MVQVYEFRLHLIWHGLCYKDWQRQLTVPRYHGCCRLFPTDLGAPPLKPRSVVVFCRERVVEHNPFWGWLVALLRLLEAVPRFGVKKWGCR